MTDTSKRHVEYFSHADVLKMLTALQGKGTRRDLARILGVHETYVSQIFSGNKELTNRVLDELDPPLERLVIYVPKKTRRKAAKNGRP